VRLGYLSAVDDFVEFGLVRPVEVVVHLAVLREHILLDLFFELVLLHKVVLAAVDLALPRPPRCVADAQLEDCRVLLQKIVYQCALAHPRASAQHQELRFDLVLLVVEESEVLLGVLVDIGGLSQ
jgi:hypothetical protein